MPRRREIPKREVPPDPIYDSTLVTKFVRCVMKNGKRSTAEGLLYGSLEIVKERTGDDPLKVFSPVLKRAQSALELPVLPRQPDPGDRLIWQVAHDLLG